MPTAGNRTVTPHAAPLSLSINALSPSLHPPFVPLRPEAGVTSHHSTFLALFPVVSVGLQPASQVCLRV